MEMRVWSSLYSVVPFSGGDFRALLAMAPVWCVTLVNTEHEGAKKLAQYIGYCYKLAPFVMAKTMDATKLKALTALLKDFERFLKSSYRKQLKKSKCTTFWLICQRL